MRPHCPPGRNECAPLPHPQCCPASSLSSSSPPSTPSLTSGHPLLPAPPGLRRRSATLYSPAPCPVPSVLRSPAQPQDHPHPNTHACTQHWATLSRFNDNVMRDLGPGASRRSLGREGCKVPWKVSPGLSPSDGGVVGGCDVMQLVAEGESGFAAEVGSRPRGGYPSLGHDGGYRRAGVWIWRGCGIQA